MVWSGSDRRRQDGSITQSLKTLDEVALYTSDIQAGKVTRTKVFLIWLVVTERIRVMAFPMLSGSSRAWTSPPAPLLRGEGSQQTYPRRRAGRLVPPRVGEGGPQAGRGPRPR